MLPVMLLSGPLTVARLAQYARLTQTRNRRMVARGLLRHLSSTPRAQRGEVAGIVQRLLRAGAWRGRDIAAFEATGSAFRVHRTDATKAFLAWYAPMEFPLPLVPRGPVFSPTTMRELARGLLEVLRERRK